MGVVRFGVTKLYRCLSEFEDGCGLSKHVGCKGLGSGIMPLAQFGMTAGIFICFNYIYIQMTEFRNTFITWFNIIVCEVAAALHYHRCFLQYTSPTVLSYIIHIMQINRKGTL